MIKVLLVGSGGFLGSASRYLLGNLIYRISNNHWFPFATLSVNVLGCLIIGFLGGVAQTKNILTDPMQLFLMVGFLGGFTTFSTFGHETMGLVRTTQSFAAFINVLLHVSLCLFAAWFGHYLARMV